MSSSLLLGSFYSIAYIKYTSIDNILPLLLNAQNSDKMMMVCKVDEESLLSKLDYRCVCGVCYSYLVHLICDTELGV